jgi:hypothetical protein
MNKCEGVDWIRSTQDTAQGVTGSCECGNESIGSNKDGHFIYQSTNCQDPALQVFLPLICMYFLSYSCVLHDRSHLTLPYSN